MFNSILDPRPGKLKLRYDGPFKIIEVLGEGTFRLADLDDVVVPMDSNSRHSMVLYVRRKNWSMK